MIAARVAGVAIGPAGLALGVVAVLACLVGLRGLCSRLRCLVRIDRGLDCGPHRVKVMCLVLVIKVAATIWQVFREYRNAPHGSRRHRGFVAARIVAGACVRVAVIVTANQNQGLRVLAAQCLCHVCQVARVKGNSHRAARCLVNACARGITFTDQQHSSANRIAAPVPKARLAPAFQK